VLLISTVFCFLNFKRPHYKICFTPLGM